jgi:two pore calcium channel protein
MKNWHSLLIQAICLIFLVFSTTLQWYFLGTKFWNRHVSIYKVGLLAIMIVFVTVSAAGMHVPEAVQLSMYIRFIIPIVFTRPIRMCFRMTAHIVHTFVNIAVLMVIFVLLSAYFATLVFGETTSEFEDYSTALVNLVVLLTTANNPNVWAPAYTADRRAFFFFFTFLLVGLFFLTNFAFTVIYSSYKAQVCSYIPSEFGVFMLQKPQSFPHHTCYGINFYS